MQVLRKESGRKAMQQVFQKYVASVLGAGRGCGKVAYGRVYKYGSKRLYHMPVGEGRVGQ